MTIKRIIHIADVHIKNYQRLAEFEESCENFFNQVEKTLSVDANGNPLTYEQRLIVIAGDLVDQKNTISNEMMVFVSKFLLKLSEFAEVLVISGNHDLVVDNNSRMDTLTGIFNTARFNHCHFLDALAGRYKSQTIWYGNIEFRLYSIWDNFAWTPESGEYILNRDADVNQDKGVVFGLFHGPIVGSKLANGTNAESGIDVSIFEGCNYVLAGDIHKRQVIPYKGGELVYPGSLFQKDRGETVSEHGFVVWDINGTTCTHTFVDVDTDYGMYNMKITSPDDIDNDKEVITNA